VETEILENLAPGDGAPLTPETFSSAYARISRSKKDVTALRKQARDDVDKARKSNKKIIFGMGHHSVAEHAVFNFDIIGVSRLALEEIEKFRLASYTEKSQRYVTLDGDYVVPAELDDDGSVALFKEALEIQNGFYFKAYGILKEYLFTKHPERAADKTERKVLEGWAKEDARYILSLAVEGQVGMTINARNLEHLFRRFALSRRQEIREIGKIMYGQVEKIAPSLILFPEPSQFERQLNDDTFKQFLAETVPAVTGDPTAASLDKGDGSIYRLLLLNYSKDGDERILAAFISLYHGIDYAKAYETVVRMDEKGKRAVFEGLFRSLEFFDSPPREFELADVTFQAVVSASNFAQLKRHRMATLVAGEYNIALGNTIPENIKKNDLEPEFKQIIQRTNDIHQLLKKRHGAAADYILTNSHNRPVIMKMNLREIYHFVRLRADAHAQWDIRDLSLQLLKQVKHQMPNSTILLCGKSKYTEEFQTIYKKPPTFKI